MEHITIRLPERVLNCVKEHYPGYSLISTKEDLDSPGQIFYIVDLLHGNKYCHLRINGAGKLIHEEAELQLMDEYQEQYY